MARINPSPDWFVGVDSFQLCVEGNWVDTVTVEVITFDNNVHETRWRYYDRNYPYAKERITARASEKRFIYLRTSLS